MTYKIQGEAPFQVLATNFSLGPSNEGYTLQVSADGNDWSDLFTVGANTTRMVTGVANGSFYRMSGNNSEVSVNWRTQCNDGGSGGGGGQYILPPATEQTLGGIKVGDGLSVESDGTLSADGGGSGVVYVSHLSDAAAAAAEVGTLVGVYKEEGLRFYSMPVNTNIKSYKIMIDGDANFSSVRIITNNNNSTLSVTLGRENGKWTKLDGRSFGVWYLDGVELGNNVTGEYDGNVLTTTNTTYGDKLTLTKNAEGDWIGTIEGNDNPYFYKIDTLNGTNAIFYEDTDPLSVNLYMKTSGGTIAHWQGYYNNSQIEPFEIIYDDLYDFTSFCNGKIMFSIRYQYGGDVRYAYMDAANQAIVYYSDSAKTSEVTRVYYLGPAVRMEAASYPSARYVWVEWKEDGVYFYNKQSSTIFENLIGFHTEGVHFTRITDPTKATASDIGITGLDNGIPTWNNEGVIVGKALSTSTKNMYFNATGTSTSARLTVLTNGTNNGPDHIFGPVDGGTAGQMLISNGNAAPIWSNWIKAVQITSAAYEALTVKDPNTLYLIVDE